MRSGARDRKRKPGSRCRAATRSVMGSPPKQSLAAVENAEDYKAFEAAVVPDYDAQSAVERELVLRLASVLWRLRRATTMETGLFEIQAEHLRDYRQSRPLSPDSRDAIHAVFRRGDTVSPLTISHDAGSNIATVPDSDKEGAPAVEFARCFLRLANLPNFALDRLSRYEATLCRQAARILYALEALDRRRFWLGNEDRIERE